MTVLVLIVGCSTRIWTESRLLARRGCLAWTTVVVGLTEDFLQLRRWPLADDADVGTSVSAATALAEIATPAALAFGSLTTDSGFRVARYN